jgi:hypothetical protein
LSQIPNAIEKSNVPQQFKSMNELIEYLGITEQRLQTSEIENRRSREIAQSSANNVDRNVISKYVSRASPQTNLLSPNFLKRAFAVWRHFFVSNSIIGVIIGIIYACLVMILFGSLFGSILQNTPK